MLQSLYALKLQIRGAKYARIILAYISILCLSKCQPESFLIYFTDSEPEASRINQGASSFMFTSLFNFFLNQVLFLLYCICHTVQLEKQCLSVHVPLCTYFMYE